MSYDEFFKRTPHSEEQRGGVMLWERETMFNDVQHLKWIQEEKKPDE